MRKAFDANVPKLKPRLRSALVEQTAEVAGAEEEAPVAAAAIPEAAEETAAAEALAPVVEEPPVVEPVVQAVPAPIATAKATPTPTPTPVATASATSEHAAGSGRAPFALRTDASAGRSEVPPDDDGLDVTSRRDRLLAVKRKVEDAIRPRPKAEPMPESPARAGESAVSLVRELEAQLARARELETALRGDLEDARAEVARGAADARRTSERLAVVEKDAEAKRATLGELLGELGALEEERDRAVERAQALAAIDEERQALLDQLSARAEEAERARGAAETEIDRLGAELDERGAEAARLRQALAQVTRERDDLAREAAAARREKAELDEARRALEQVHDALSQARSRLS